MAAGGPAQTPLFLGLDIGTTHIAAQVVDAGGAVQGVGTARVAVRVGPDGSAEQDMGAIGEAVEEVLRAAARAVDAARISALGVSSQAGALQVLDAGGRCLGPVIGWQDARGAPWDRALTQRMGPDWFARHCGTPRSFLSMGQIMRLRETGALPAGCRIGWVGDVMVGRLCGRRAQDATSLSEAGLCNPVTGREDAEILKLLQLSPEVLPDLLPATQPAGALLRDVADRTGLPAGIPVGPAVHDQYAAAVGCGVVHPGETMLGAGTAWVLLSLSDALRPPVSPTAIAGRHPAAGVFGQLLTMVDGGACVAWALDLCNRAGAGVAEVDALMAAAPAGSDGLRFRPLLSPLGAPGLPPGLAGRLDGLRFGHTAAHVVRSLVEGMACELRRIARSLSALPDPAGRGPLRSLVMCGKAAQSSVTPGILADTLGIPVECVTVAEASSLGAAVCARALVTPSIALAALSHAMRPARTVFTPGPGQAEAEARFSEYVRSLSLV